MPYSLREVSTQEFPSRLTLSLLLILFLGGLGLRLLDLTDPPLDFHPTRQLRAAVIARGMYAQMQPTWPLTLDWLGAEKWEGASTLALDPERRQLAIDLWHSMAIYEPQIFERLVAITYCLLGAEVLWVARIYSAIFWILGGIPLYALARRATSISGGIMSLAFYLFLPLGVYASRSFQPDPLMVSLVILSAYLAYRWSEEKTWGRAVLTGIFSGLAVAIKAPAVFQVALILLFTTLVGWGFKKAIRQPQIWVVAVLASSIPAYFYFVLKVTGSSSYLDYWSTSFAHMLLEPRFYVNWLVFLKNNIVEIGLFFIGLAGIALLAPRAKAVAMGLWLGYGIYGLVLPYLITTHTYYSLPLIPTIALSLAPFASLIYEAVSRQPRVWQAFFYAVLVMAVIFPAWISRSTLLGSDYRQEILGWQKIGEELPKDGKIIAITHDYGTRLQYYGWAPVDYWPSTADQQMEGLRGDDTKMMVNTFDQITKGYGYFLVTLPKELEKQKQLSDILYNNYPILADRYGYLLFDLKP